MTYQYAYQGQTEGTARAVMTALPISTKTATMLAQFLRGKTVERARRDLQAILKKTVAVPFTRFTDGAGHKPGKIAAGKYPEKASMYFLRLLESAVANADDIGLAEERVIVGLTAHKAGKSPRAGRHRGRTRKSTHVEMVIAEVVEENKN